MPIQRTGGRSRSFILMYDLASRRPVKDRKDLSRFERVLAGWLDEEVERASREGELVGFLAVACGMRVDFGQGARVDYPAAWLEKVGALFRPLASAAIRQHTDQPTTEGPANLSDENGRLWLVLFHRPSRERAHKVADTYKFLYDKHFRAIVTEDHPQPASPTTRQASDIERLFDDLPADAGPRLEVANARVDAFRQEARGHLQGTLNAYLADQKPETFAEKQKIVETINAALDRLGLSISHKGQICNFTSTVGKDYPNGRFLIVPKGGRAPSLARVQLSDCLPLELTEAQHRRGEPSEWAARVASAGEAGRGSARTD